MSDGLKRSLLVIGLALLLPFALGPSDIKSLIIEAVEDSYVVTDIADDEDTQGFRDQNYGSLEFLKTWYAWGVVGDERLISIDLIKFDLSELKDRDIESVSLQLFARTANLAESARLVDIHRVRDPWSQSDVTFNTRPAWDPAPVATAAIYGAGGWYSWNVTGTTIAGIRNGEVSFAVALRTIAEETEEQVVFVSTEGVARAPRLLVTYEAPGTAVPWWWWAIGAAVVVVVGGGAFVIGRRRQPAPRG